MYVYTCKYIYTYIYIYTYMYIYRVYNLTPGPFQNGSKPVSTASFQRLKEQFVGMICCLYVYTIYVYMFVLPLSVLTLSVLILSVLTGWHEPMDELLTHTVGKNWDSECGVGVCDAYSFNITSTLNEQQIALKEFSPVYTYIYIYIYVYT
jgi:hypothetical protein